MMKRLVLPLLLLSACASKVPVAEVAKAPAIGFVRSLTINGEPVPAGVCTLFVAGVAIPLTAGEAFTAELPIGHADSATVSCNRGVFKTDITLTMTQELNIKPEALNLLADFTIKLATQRNAVGMYLMGGQITGGFHYKPLGREVLKLASVDLRKLKRHSAIKFEYVVVPN